MTRVAAIDCGTNSIRLLVADVANGSLTDLTRQMRVVRLGQGVDRTGEFAEEALARTFKALDDYAATCRLLRVEHIRFVATSATRDARNRDVFLEGVRSRIGVTPDVISGDEEAALSFRGVTSSITQRARSVPRCRPWRRLHRTGPRRARARFRVLHGRWLCAPHGAAPRERPANGAGAGGRGG